MLKQQKAILRAKRPSKLHNVNVAELVNELYDIVSRPKSGGSCAYARSPPLRFVLLRACASFALPVGIASADIH